MQEKLRTGYHETLLFLCSLSFLPPPLIQKPRSAVPFMEHENVGLNIARKCSYVERSWKLDRSVDDKHESSTKERSGGLFRNAGPEEGVLDIVDVDVLVIVASVTVLVELDVVIDAFVTVAVGGRE